MAKSSQDVRQAKERYMEKIVRLFKQYKRCLFIRANNVGAKQMQEVRMALRGKAVVLMGKNTLIRKAFRDNLDKSDTFKRMLPLIKGNIGFIFTDGDVAEIRTTVESMKVPAAAKQGQISDVTVIIPAGSTGMEPTKTSFFQALDIPTKITRGCVDIVRDHVLLRPGDRVGNSEATLLQMLNIKPFSYGLLVSIVVDDGSIYDAKILDLTEEDKRFRFMQGARRIAAIGLATGIPNEASIPHSIVNSFKQLLHISVATEYTFEQSKGIKEFLKDPSKFAVAAPAAGAGAGKAEEAKEPEPSSSSSDAGLGGLF